MHNFNKEYQDANPTALTLYVHFILHLILLFVLMWMREDKLWLWGWHISILILNKYIWTGERFTAAVFLPKWNDPDRLMLICCCLMILTQYFDRQSMEKTGPLHDQWQRKIDRWYHWRLATADSPAELYHRSHDLLRCWHRSNSNGPYKYKKSTNLMSVNVQSHNISSTWEIIIFSIPQDSGIRRQI